MRCLLVMLALIAAFRASRAHAYEGQRANSVLLNGTWQFALGSGDEGGETPEGQAALEWQEVDLPGQFMPWDEEVAKNLAFVWAKRSFSVSEPQARSLAVLRWNRIALGAVAYINGQEVGRNEPTGPYQVIIPEGTLWAGDNEIVLKVAGGAGVRRAESGYFLIPSGFATLHRRGMPAVTDDVWIDFADGAYMKWVLAIPDLSGSQVRIRVTLTGVEPADGLRIEAKVRPWPEGDVIGSGEAEACLTPDPDPLGGEHFTVGVPMPGFRAWTHEACNLYTAEVVLRHGERVLDTLDFRFGMREFEADGNFTLNGRDLRLRGSNLVFEWDWGDIVTGKEKDYLVTEAREMSMNSFRTHTQPLPRHWADVCDEYGTMILAEFPALYNYRNYEFTPDEYEIWHRNVLADAAGWMARLWNHPSVVMWVLTNESKHDSDWETGPYRDFVRALDPTRPTMRSGGQSGGRYTGTAENLDIHHCGNTVQTDEGGLIRRIDRWIEQAGARTLTNTEYMNIFRRPVEQWTGTDDRGADRLAYAQLGMEHTEAMRRARLDGIWPYMYAGWTRTRRDNPEWKERHGEPVVWKAGFAQPVSACWHSSLSPVLASLDLFDPNYVTGQEVRTELHLINDSWQGARVHVDLLLTRENPEFIPEAECLDEPLAQWGFDFDLGADTVTRTPVAWRLPAREGAYWLTARTTGMEGRAVLSQRFVRAVDPPEVPKRLTKRTFVILGGDFAAEDYFRSRDLRTTNWPDRLEAGKHVVVVWDPSGLTRAEKESARDLCDFAAAGGRVVVLSTRAWEWEALCDVGVPERGGPYSRVFPYGRQSHPVLRGIDPEFLKRWNGLPGTVAVADIRHEGLRGSGRILWGRDSTHTVVAEVPASEGEGKILLSQLDIRNHVDRTGPRYDPVAERVFLNMLGL